MEEKQDICLFSRKRLKLTGVTEVGAFTDEQITLSSKLGMIAIEGEDLKIGNFSAESGELNVTGEIDGIYYFEPVERKEKHGFFSKKSKDSGKT